MKSELNDIICHGNCEATNRSYKTEQYMNSIFVSGTIWKNRLCMRRQMRGSNQPFINATNSTTCSLSRFADTE